MKIFIRNEESKDINIKLPIALITTALRFLKKSYIEVDEQTNSILNNIFNVEDKKNLIKGLKYLNKHHKGLVLVDVEDSHGCMVKIEI